MENDATYRHEITVLIASTLEKLQDLNPERYGDWYSLLYSPHGIQEHWNVKTLHTLEQLLIDYAK